MIGKSWLDALSSVVFAAPCRVCGRALTTASRIPICPDCLDSFTRITDPLCQRCGRPFVSPVAAQAAVPLCRLCRLNTYAFDQARSYAIYSAALFEAIILMKHEEVAALGEWFAARLVEIAGSPEARWRPDRVVPVPLHGERRRERGYNQAELIAGPLAKRVGASLDPGLLIRTKPRPLQLLLSRSQRWESVRGAYVTQKGSRVDKLCILLVDDVFTTGATLDSCARALKKAGAATILALTVGRAVPGWFLPGTVRKN